MCVYRHRRLERDLTRELWDSEENHSTAGSREGRRNKMELVSVEHVTICWNAALMHLCTQLAAHSRALLRGR